MSSPLDAPPAFLSTISMTADDQTEIVKKLQDAEMPTPAFYRPARDLFLRTLSGDLTFERAFNQAHDILEPTDRKCAIAVLNESKNFLIAEEKTTVKKFPRKTIALPAEIELTVSPIFVRHTHPKRFLVLYFWNTPLSSRQIGAVAATVRAVAKSEPEYEEAELDFISVALNSSREHREFRHLNWAKCKPLSDEELERFWKNFAAAWERYRRLPPREIRRRRSPGFL